MTDNGQHISFWSDRNVLKLDGDDGCRILEMYQNGLNCIFKTHTGEFCGMETMSQ